MILEGQQVDRDTEGRRSTTLRMSFGSQQEQVMFLRSIVRVYRGRLPIRQKAVEIVQEAGVPPKHKLAQALAIGTYCQETLYYVNEGIETFQTPIRTLRNGFGDCDDYTTLIASLCEAIGIPCRLEAIAVQRTPPGLGDLFRDDSRALIHIFPVAVVNGRRVPLDGTLDLPIGTDPVRVIQRRGRYVRTFVG